MKTYPIAELFHSIQGEGVWTGTPMFFVRLAGCNVGKYEETPKEYYHNTPTTPETQLAGLRILHPRHSICTTAFGDRFLCDTDYHKWKDLTTQEILEKCYEDHVCITGGEPFLHDLVNLIDECRLRRKSVHIETSGTLPIAPTDAGWITCAPKEGFDVANSSYIDEWKFLADPKVDPKCTVERIERFLAGSTSSLHIPIYIQPINDVETINSVAVKVCLEILILRPQWRLSAQLHKLLGVR